VILRKAICELVCSGCDETDRSDSLRYLSLETGERFAGFNIIHDAVQLTVLWVPWTGVGLVSW